MQNEYGKNSIFLLCIVKLLESHKMPVPPSAGTFRRFCTPSTPPLASSLGSAGKAQRPASSLQETEQITAQHDREEVDREDDGPTPSPQSPVHCLCA